MKKIFILLFTLLTGWISAIAQCNVDTITNAFYRFLNPGSQTDFTGFLCTTTDSVGTAGNLGYYDGNGFTIKLISGTEVIFYTDSCGGQQVSMTIVDSADNIISGAYASPACTNTLDFTAPYTGRFSVVLNLNGVCGGFGGPLLGQVYVKIKPGTQAPSCSVEINDTLCGAIRLQVDSGFSAGNTANAYPTDPLDAYLASIGATSCSPPNNTMWYYFQSPIDIDTVNIWVTSGAGSGFHSWVVGFVANDSSDFCNGGLTFIDCAGGAADELGIDTVSFPLYGVGAGQVYIFMIDGFNGGMDPFSIGLKSQPYYTGIEENSATVFNIFPNPAIEEVNIFFENPLTNSKITISDISGKTIFEENISGILKKTISTGQFSPGIYLVTLRTQNGVFQKKVCLSPR